LSPTPFLNYGNSLSSDKRKAVFLCRENIMYTLQILGGVSLLSYVIILVLSSMQAARFVGNGGHPYFWSSI
jgi:hypothetical protein